jgi:hypothetical protein
MIRVNTVRMDAALAHRALPARTQQCVWSGGYGAAASCATVVRCPAQLKCVCHVRRVYGACRPAGYSYVSSERPQANVPYSILKGEKFFGYNNQLFCNQTASYNNLSCTNPPEQVRSPRRRGAGAASLSHTSILCAAAARQQQVVVRLCPCALLLTFSAPRRRTQVGITWMTQSVVDIDTKGVTHALNFYMKVRVPGDCARGRCGKWAPWLRQPA